METKKMIKEQEEIKNGAIAPAMAPAIAPAVEQKKEVVKKKVIHYKDAGCYAICGVSTKNLTRDSEKVTCKNCMRTKYWNEFHVKK